MHKLVESLKKAPPTKRMADQTPEGNKTEKDGKKRNTGTTPVPPVTLPNPTEMLPRNITPQEPMQALSITDKSNTDNSGISSPGPRLPPSITKETEQVTNKEIIKMFEESPEDQKTESSGRTNTSIEDKSNADTDKTSEQQTTGNKQATTSASNSDIEEVNTENDTVMNDESFLDEEESENIFRLVCEQMRSEEANQEPGSFAAVAAKKPKISYKHAVYIHRGTKERQALPKAMFKAFEAMIWQEREKLPIGQNEKN